MTSCTTDISPAVNVHNVFSFVSPHAGETQKNRMQAIHAMFDEEPRKFLKHCPKSNESARTERGYSLTGEEQKISAECIATAATSRFHRRLGDIGVSRRPFLDDNFATRLFVIPVYTVVVRGALWPRC